MKEIHKIGFTSSTYSTSTYSTGFVRQMEENEDANLNKSNECEDGPKGKKQTRRKLDQTHEEVSMGSPSGYSSSSMSSSSSEDDDVNVKLKSILRKRLILQLPLLLTTSKVHVSTSSLSVINCVVYSDMGGGRKLGWWRNGGTVDGFYQDKSVELLLDGVTVMVNP
ncbi:hypothetical protein EZV62_015901 [Acer yangbiense]|uniref:Uncharacterized protein n=1 Tax=Acer yangbiense TaxID=1000413 RepID=A0A5C7HPG9_9ROSI|nr:hypothetical protein EZV62_015901 [Acer yangbiense]